MSDNVLERTHNDGQAAAIRLIVKSSLAPLVSLPWSRLCAILPLAEVGTVSDGPHVKYNNDFVFGYQCEP